MKIATIIFIIFLGAFFWLSNYHIIELSRDWPVILVVIGLLALIKKPYKKRKFRVVVDDDEAERGILNDLEDGKISAEEAEKKFRKKR